VDLRLAHAFPTLRRQRVEVTAGVFNAAHLLNRRWGAQQLLLAGISDQNPVNQHCRFSTWSAASVQSAERHAWKELQPEAGVP